MGLIEPGSRFHRYWNLTLFVAIFYNAVSLSFRLAFDHPWQGHFLYLDLIADAIFLTDIYFAYHIAYVRDGKVQRSPRAIKQTYRASGAKLDYLSLLPLDWLSLLYFTPIGSTTIALLRLPRLIRLIHFHRVFNIWEKNSHRGSSFYRLAKLLLLILLCTHVVGCAWFRVGMWESQFGHSWLAEHNLLERSIGIHYLYSWYWAITTITTVGYGDITPSTDFEVGFTIGAMVLGVSVWAYVIGNVASLVANLDATKTSFRQKMDGVKQYMHYRRLPQEMQHRVIQYYDFLWSEGKALEEQQVFQDLPTGLRREIGLYLNKEIVQKVPFFRGMDEGFVRTVVALLKPQVFCPGDHIITKGEIGHEMYLLSRGKVDVLNEKGEIVHSYHSGDFFGELALLYTRKRSATVVASTHCDLFVLTKEELASIFDYYPDFQERLREIGHERLEAAENELETV